MDMMEVRRRVIMSSNKNIVLPNNVTYCTFTLDAPVKTNDVTIPNPLGSIAYKKILIIRFAESEPNGTVIGMFANPNAGRDSDGNRKIQSSANGVVASPFYPWIAFTAESITLRGANGGEYPAGTYHVFAWDKNN